ncbi:MAG: hypothetical protein RIQ93_621 [Verrucomicrobiota bacterium]|jgi:4-hydroxy-2-oxoheptanedioate aldolase
MRKSKVLAKIRSGEVARLCAMGSFLPYFPRLANAAGFDGIWVDGEHKPFTARETQALIAFHHLADIDCLWRPPTREKNGLYRILEDGATGLIISHVGSAAEAQAIVDAAKFPPLGDRGLDGAGFDAEFGKNGGASYPADANRETALFVQVETPQALAQVEAIAAVAGVDGIFLGPGDLSLRLGCKPDATDPVMADVHRQLAVACSRHAKVWGRPVANQTDLDLVLAAGAGFVVFGGEFRMIQNALADCGKALDRALEKRAATG